MRTLEKLFENNRQWASSVERQEPGFFASLIRQQSPDYLWIGCSDSRVPANEIVGLKPGELFVHRNVANLVQSSDLNCASVIEYAVETLRVRHIIVCGHYGCGGVQAAADHQAFGLVDRWLKPLSETIGNHSHVLAHIGDPLERLRRCCELNVVEQVRNVCMSGPVDAAWRRDWELSVHGWIYDIADGLLRDLGLCVTSPGDVEATCESAVEAMAARA